MKAENLKNKNVLVTGAAGFVGRHLVRKLAAEKACVRILVKDRQLSGFEDKTVKVHGDITDPSTLFEVMDGTDIVFHLAAISNVNYAIANPGKTFETNASGTLNLLEEARKKNIEKFVYVSSSHVYGIPQYLPIDEKHPLNPQEPYAASKASAEMIVKVYSLNYGINTALIRPFNMYGPGQSTDFIIPSIISQALKKEVIEVGNLTPTRDLLYIMDAVDGMIAVADRGEGIYNIGSGRETSIKEIVETIIEIIDPSKKYVSVETRRRSNAVDIPRMCADVSKLKEFGWSPSVDLKSGLMKTINEDSSFHC